MCNNYLGLSCTHFICTLRHTVQQQIVDIRRHQQPRCAYDVTSNLNTGKCLYIAQHELSNVLNILIIFVRFAGRKLLFMAILCNVLTRTYLILNTLYTVHTYANRLIADDKNYKYGNENRKVLMSRETKNVLKHFSISCSMQIIKLVILTYRQIHLTFNQLKIGVKLVLLRV